MQQRVLITAGAGGIGREIARAFAASGAKVFVCDIDAEGLESLAQEIEDLTTTVCDVSKREDIERMVTSAIESLGGLDVLVNNAGISGPTAPVDKMDPDDWDKVVQVNLNGTFNVTRLAIPHLKKSPAGVINHHLFCGRKIRLRESEPLFGNQMGLDWLHQDALHRTRRIRNSCECHSARRCRRTEVTKGI